MSNPLRVLISMTEKDLGSHGLQIATWIRRGCQRRVEARIMYEFRHYDGKISRKLRQEVEECDVIIHVVGKRYGSAPKTEQYIAAPGYSCSYTQLEYWLARDSKKQIFVILCSDDFPYAPVDRAEEVRERELQDDHRRYLDRLEVDIYRVESTQLLEVSVHRIIQTLLLDDAERWEQFADKWRLKYRRLQVFSFSAVALMASAVMLFNAAPLSENVKSKPGEATKPTIYSAPTNEVNVIASIPVIRATSTPPVTVPDKRGN